MKKCPFCAESIQDDAVKCRYCGEFLDGRQRSAGLPLAGYYFGYEYKSKRTLFGLPILHVAQGIHPETGLPRVAKGIIAVGNVAIGVVAVGGFALGGICLGGMGLGLLTFAGMAAGVVAFGGVAVAIYLAVGGIAVSAAYGIGGLALAPHAISSAGIDPEFVDKLEKLFPDIRKALR